MSAANLRCVNCSSYLFNGPFQCSCGDRLCRDCFQTFKTEKKMIFTCPKCGEEISLDDCFKDRAAENELRSATIKCANQDCPWEGLGQYYKEHVESCKFKKVLCPNKIYGCPKLLLQSQLDEHLEGECRFTPVECPWCSKNFHNTEMSNHVKEDCTVPLTDIQQVQEGCTTKQLGKLNTESCFVCKWTIPDIQCLRDEAKSRNTISLCSAPFYTSRHGYKMRLRLYLDGDGSGKGTHISFFLMPMRGEYDALLPWPFNQEFTLILLDQDERGRHYIRSFKPDPESPSFQQPSPHSEMNVASGCPQFAPLSILDNPAYVKRDTMILKCKVINNGCQ